MLRSRCLFLAGLVGLAVVGSGGIRGACCYFSAKNADILQPAQKAFLTWDPDEKIETFTVQPKFEGNALDFGMVIPTPSQPKLHEMPRDFFKHLAVYTIMKKREFPVSHLLPQPPMGRAGGFGGGRMLKAAALSDRDEAAAPRKPAIKVLEAGVVGSLDYKIIEAGRADDLYKWLKDNRYSYSGDEATLGFYVQKKWIFTVMKIDTMQMKRNKDGTFAGEVSPTRFQFASEKLVYPLKITQISVKDKTEALFYVQAPTKVDLKGDFSYQMTWVPMLQAGMGCTPGGIQGGGEQWLKAFGPQIPALMARARELGFNFIPGQRPQPGKDGCIPTTMEWSRKLTAKDVAVLKGDAPYSEKVPNVDEGFTQADLKDPQKAQAIYKVIQARLAKAHHDRPIGYLVREAPAEDVRGLQQLAGHVREGGFITKFRKFFLRSEMNDDLEMVPARYGDANDSSEYEELLPVSPP
ncbi:MAG TPA: DUF2330 domain-containing protein [Gemmataceae bacterium]|jgi:hypothetical protein|nr:DUF2330 domain-containing protein [Gemmataceae bacterium]